MEYFTIVGADTGKKRLFKTRLLYSLLSPWSLHNAMLGGLSERAGDTQGIQLTWFS